MIDHLAQKQHEETLEVHVSLLGQFTLTANETSVSDNENRSHKMWELLAFLIIQRGRFIPKEVFIQKLWPDEDSQSPGNALKTLLYRVRVMLEPLQLACGNKELILAQRGGYGWNPAIACHTDVDEFEVLCQQAEDEALSQAQRRELLQKAVALYQGRFLPKLSLRLWIVPLAAYYHGLYLRAVKSLAAILQEAECYQELDELCQQAIAQEALDEELYGYQILALIRQGKDNTAMLQYEAATTKLYHDLGIKPSARMHGLYQEIQQTQKALEMDLDAIQRELRETEAQSGAFFCEYGFFREAYRLDVRRLLRQQAPMFIALLTVAFPDDQPPAAEALEAVMARVKEILRADLRKGDIVARYSVAQYVIMLSTNNALDSEMVINRIAGHFYSARGADETVRLHYKIQEIG